jgi:hypothetical protein
MATEVSQAPRVKTAAQTSADTQTSLFPLRFTPFEFYFFIEDRPDYPGVIPIEIETHGRLDSTALARAYELTHLRHPLLSARVEMDRKGWPQWVAGEPEPIDYDVRTQGCARSPAGVPAGVRLLVRRTAEKTVFLFEFRHTAVDGLGAFQFMSDLFVAYAHLCSGRSEPIPWRQLEPERLRNRDGHHLFTRKVKLVDLLRMAQVHVPLSLRQAALVSEDKERQPSDRLVPSLPSDFLVEHLTQEETAALCGIAAEQSVMLNDLLVRDYFLMLVEWNRGTSQERRPVRILIPTNMRRREDRRMPAANVFGYAFLSRTGTDCDDREGLLKSISDEMAAIKLTKRGVYYEAALRLFCYLPWFLRWSLNRKWAFATAVFTNLGTGFDNIPLPARDGRKLAGDLVFDIGAGAGPIRPGTRISFAAHIYAGRLAIGARCDPNSLTPSQQRALLNAYCDRLRTTIGRDIGGEGITRQ